MFNRKSLISGKPPVEHTIYGAEWSGNSETTWTRTDDAVGFSNPNPYYAGMSGTPSSPFDNISPWKDITATNITGVGKVVQIPKYYYKWTKNGKAMKLQIAVVPFGGSSVSPAHADRGDGKGEREVVYVGRYHCATSTYKTNTDKLPQTSKTREDFRTNIHNLGSNVWQWDFAMFWTIAMLYLVEFANWNSQSCIGYGCGNGSSTEKTGSTDSMPYHTGTMASSRNTYNVGIQYRNIEGLWSNVLDFVDGIYFDGGAVFCIKNPANFSDVDGGVDMRAARASGNRCIQEYNVPNSSSDFAYAVYPKWAEENDYNLYVTDRNRYLYNGKVLRVGGSFNQGQEYGLFFWHGYSRSDEKGAGVGSRLMVLP